MKIFALAVLFVVACGRGEDATSKQPLIGTKAPAFDLPNTVGQRVALESYRGKYVVLHFGTSW